MTFVFKSKADEYVTCMACAATIHHRDSHTDSDGFTGCPPCFPISNRPEDSNRFLRGPCSRKSAEVPS